ncbi:MAG TPA: alcohol dehydrogenase catalytic domain-containing protein [Acidimicrobiia bacterium]|nr:alcohol dehydrogenase catalytic domain-containing protein [Acidimicrobiia bacterium]
MKAALLVEPGRLVVDDVHDPEPGPGEVLISVGGVGLCGSDVSVFSGKWKAPSYPWIMGHEAFGVIEALGRGVSPGRLGDTVVIEPNLPCFTCDQCSRGRTSACVQRSSVGMNRVGALAERVVVPDRFAWSMPGVPVTDLVCVEPTTVVVAALRRLGPLPESALVVGVGAQGLVMTLALMERGVAVYAQDVNPDRVAFAVDLGASPADNDDARRFRLVVDTVGSPSSMASAIDRVDDGTVLCLGLDSRPLDLSAQTLVRRQLTLRGSLTYDHPVDFAEVTALIAGGGFSPGRIITDEHPLEDAQLAFEGSGSTRGKTWIRIAG